MERGEQMSSSFNANFYVAAATVIPILYLAITLQGSTFEDLMRRLRKALPENQPTGSRRTPLKSIVSLALTVLITVIAVVLIFGGISAEFVSFVALYQQRSSSRMDRDVLALIGGLLVVVIAGPVIKFLLIYFGSRSRRHSGTENPQQSQRNAEASPTAGPEASSEASGYPVRRRNSLHDLDMQKVLRVGLLAAGFALGRLIDVGLRPAARKYWSSRPGGTGQAK
jgi:hypothetical protein